jgi:hypothetical protein
MGLCEPYGCETHMLMVAEIVIGDHFCTSPAYVLRAKYWVVDWAWATSLIACFHSVVQYVDFQEAQEAQTTVYDSGLNQEFNPY